MGALCKILKVKKKNFSVINVPQLPFAPEVPGSYLDILKFPHHMVGRMIVDHIAFQVT